MVNKGIAAIDPRVAGVIFVLRRGMGDGDRSELRMGVASKDDNDDDEDDMVLLLECSSAWRILEVEWFRPRLVGLFLARKAKCFHFLFAVGVEIIVFGDSPRLLVATGGGGGGK